ncbi:unnamed protein product [Zymoseptoria tritici ST99CH_3D1]|nr:unnamed protein product [Zymoseptoria tritici ST99CH_3D1]
MDAANSPIDEEIVSPVPDPAEYLGMDAAGESPRSIAAGDEPVSREMWWASMEMQPHAGYGASLGSDGSSSDREEGIEMDLDVSVVDLEVDELIGGNGWNWGNDWIWVFDEHQQVDEMDDDMSEADSLGYIGDESIDEGYDGDDEREWDEWWKATR